MARQTPTIRDVARAAGVSAMTVSRVLNGHPGVRPETARRIEEAVRTLGYRPNMLATTLRWRQQLSLIGMIVPDPHPAVFTSFAVEVNERVRDDGLIVVTASSEHDTKQERALVTSFIERGFDGIVLFSTDSDHQYLSPELNRGRPIVFMGSPPQGVEAPTVLVDNRGGARDAVKHLADRGHHRIGIVGSTAFFPASERLAGYHEAIEAHGLDTDPDLTRIGPLTPAAGRAAAESLLGLPDPPTGIFSTNYLLSSGVLAALRKHRDSVELVVFDDFEAASLFDLPITVVTQDPPTMSRHASRMLRSQLAGDGDRAERVIVPVNLVTRGQNSPWWA